MFQGLQCSAVISVQCLIDHGLPLSFWTNCFVFLGLSFPICKVGIDNCAEDG